MFYKYRKRSPKKRFDDEEEHGNVGMGADTEADR